MKTRTGIFTRKQGAGQLRYYARLPDATRVALAPPGQTRATTDLSVAEALFAQRLTAYQQAQLRGVLGVAPKVTLADFVAQHLVAKAKIATITTEWIASTELMLT